LDGVCPGHKVYAKPGLCRAEKDEIRERRDLQGFKRITAQLAREAVVEAKKLKIAEEQALKTSKKEFMDSTISTKELKSQFGLTDKDLVSIGSVTYGGFARYKRVDVFRYVSLKKKPQKQGSLL